MDNATLIEPVVEDGKRLIKALDISGLGVKAAFWLYLEESEEWRLYIATPLVKEYGPREVYSRVLKVLKESKISSIDLSEISVIDTADGLVTVLSLAFNTGPGITDIKFAGNTVNGVYVRAAHIYRMNVR
jgi:hypothetical protein